jgi:hypothetical protein
MICISDTGWKNAGSMKGNASECLSRKRNSLSIHKYIVEHDSCHNARRRNCHAESGYSVRGSKQAFEADGCSVQGFHSDLGHATRMEM